jgi:hypothetical protein
MGMKMFIRANISTIDSSEKPRAAIAEKIQARINAQHGGEGRAEPFAGQSAVKQINARRMQSELLLAKARMT